MKRIKNKFHKLTKDTRLYHSEKPIIGLTGGIASGKSTVSNFLRSKGIEIIDADNLVKSIYQKDKSKSFIKENFPTAWDNDKINFKILRRLAFNNPAIKNKLENFIYAFLPEAFIEASKKIINQDFLIYDIPLLFEKGLEKKIDVTLVVYADRELQLNRLIKRDNIAIDLSNKILDQQMDIEIKKNKADFIINNQGDISELKKEVDDFLKKILEK